MIVVIDCKGQWAMCFPHSQDWWVVLPGSQLPTLIKGQKLLQKSVPLLSLFPYRLFSFFILFACSPSWPFGSYLIYYLLNGQTSSFPKFYNFTSAGHSAHKCYKPSLNDVFKSIQTVSGLCIISQNTLAFWCSILSLVPGVAWHLFCFCFCFLTKASLLKKWRCQHLVS